MSKSVTLAVGFSLSVACMNAIAPASAQSLLEIVAGLKFCRTLTDDAQRLKCFDGLVMDKPREQPKTPEVAAAWAIEENKSPVDDSPQVAGTLHGIGDSGSDAFLILRGVVRPYLHLPWLGRADQGADAYKRWASH
jgi:hypothetical protein